MSKIKFDEDSKRYFEAGVSDVALYVKNDTQTVPGTWDNGHHGYTEGVAWNGCTSISESPEGAEANDLWADNIKYASMYSAETMGGSIEAYTYPDEFGVCDGSAGFVNNSNAVKGFTIGQQPRKPFALVYKTRVGSDTDTEMSNYKLHILYGLMATPSEKSYETINDSPDAITFSWDFNSTPVVVGRVGGVDYKPTSLVILDTSKMDSSTKAKLAVIEGMLYGVDADAEHSVTEVKPNILMPDEIYTQLVAA